MNKRKCYIASWCAAKYANQLAADRAEADRRFGQPHFGHDEREEHRADDDGMALAGAAAGVALVEAAVSGLDLDPATPDFSGGGGDFGGGGASGSW